MTPPMAPHARFWLVLISAALCLALAGMCTAWLWALGRLWSRRGLLAQAKPRAVPWGTGSVLAVIVVWGAMYVAVPVAYLGLTGALSARRKPTFTEQIAVVSLVNGVLLVVVPLTLRRTARTLLAAFGLERAALGRTLVVGMVGFLLATPAVYLVNGLSILIWKEHKHPLEEMVVAGPTVGIACLAFVSAVVLAPAAEELVFRGILQSWLVQFFRRGDRSLSSDAGEAPAVPPMAPIEEPDPGPWHEPLAPVLLTSALFAVIHLPQWPAPIAIFFLSVGLGVVYQRTGSLVASFVMHALFNGFSTLILFQAILLGRPSDVKNAPTATCFCVDWSAAAPPGGCPTPGSAAVGKTFIQARFSIGAGSGGG
jgi:membrane protease YdiL (CAAX protease family)